MPSISSRRAQPQHITRAHEHSHTQPHASNEYHTPHIREPQTRIVEINISIHRPRCDIPPAQHIQIPNVHFRNIGRNHCRCEKRNVLKAILLAAFGADDQVFVCFRNGLVLFNGANEGARLGVVEGLGGGALVDFGGVDVGDDWGELAWCGDSAGE